MFSCGFGRGGEGYGLYGLGGPSSKDTSQGWVSTVEPVQQGLTHTPECTMPSFDSIMIMWSSMALLSGFGGYNRIDLTDRIFRSCAISFRRRSILGS